jgi:tRNA A37 threonylcarbamoyladenosine dehydratase
VDERFRGFKQLVGSGPFSKISRASVCVVGVGGVGSWVVEALARSGIGALTLVDLDEVCVTNINRQIHALSGTVGASKVEILAERVLQIHPSCAVAPIKRFFTESSAESILSAPFDLVIDTIDRVENKALLLADCVERDLPVITVGSGGERLNPAGAVVCDLARTIHDPLLQCVRKTLRQHHGFPKGERAKFMIPCVYAPLQRGPRPAQARAESDDSCGVDLREARGRKSCNDGLGSAVFMTGTLGFMAAAEAVRLLGEESPRVVYRWKRVPADAPV